MNSFFAKLYLDLLDRIDTEVPEIKWREQNFGQYLNEEFRLLEPACFIDFPQTTYSEMGQYNQLGKATISLLLLFPQYSQSYGAAPDGVKEQALQYFDIEQKLVKAIHGWKTDYTTTIMRMSAKSQNRNDLGLRIRELDFECEFQEEFTEDLESQTVTFIATGQIN